MLINERLDEGGRELAWEEFAAWNSDLLTWRPSMLARYYPDPVWNETVLRLGAGPDGSEPFYGLIDEVLLFRRVLSADDLVHVMRATWLDAR